MTAHSLTLQTCLKHLKQEIVRSVISIQRSFRVGLAFSKPLSIRGVVWNSSAPASQGSWERIKHAEARNRSDPQMSLSRSKTQTQNRRKLQQWASFSLHGRNAVMHENLYFRGTGLNTENFVCWRGIEFAEQKLHSFLKFGQIKRARRWSRGSFATDRNWQKKHPSSAAIFGILMLGFHGSCLPGVSVESLDLRRKHWSGKQWSFSDCKVKTVRMKLWEYENRIKQERFRELWVLTWTHRNDSTWCQWCDHRSWYLVGKEIDAVNQLFHEVGWIQKAVLSFTHSWRRLVGG